MSCEKGIEVLFVAAVLPDADFAIAESIGEPARDDRDKPLVVADMGFVGADKVHMGKLVRHDAEQIALDSVRMKINGAGAVVCCPFAKLLVRGPLNSDSPPFAVELEAQGRALWFAPLLHLSL